MEIDWRGDQGSGNDAEKASTRKLLRHRDTDEADWLDFAVGNGSLEEPTGTKASQSVYEAPTEAAHTVGMSEITREELDAKLAATEARMDARLERFDKDMRQVVSEFRLEVQPLKSLKSSLWTATAAIIGSVVATAVAVASLSFGAFDSGRETSQLVEQAKQQSAENRRLLDQIDEKLKSIPADPSSLKNLKESGVVPKP